MLNRPDNLSSTPFEARVEDIRNLLPEGFIPQYSPDLFINHLSTLVEFKQNFFNGERLTWDIDRVALHGHKRNEYDNDNNLPDRFLEAQSDFPNILVYNQQINQDGEVKPVSFNDRRYIEAIQLAIDFMKQQGDTIIAGFAGEKSSVRTDLEVAIDYVGSGHVIAVDAGIDPNATIEALKAGCKVLDQQAILQACFDWDAMQNLYGLPYSNDQLPSGKGTSHWVGTAYADAIGLLTPTAHLIQKDTDVLNPHQWIPEIYLALARIYAPAEDPVKFTQILRTGEGRNNEPWLYQANALANARTESKGQLGIVLGSLTWPLSDARSGEWEIISKLPTSNSMGMETIRNVGVAGLSIEKQKRLIAQVVNPDRKIENMVSPADREFNIIFHCAQFLRDLAIHIKETGLFLHHWAPDQIRSFNTQYGGERTITFVPPAAQRANLLRFTRQEYILPSIYQMKQDGVIDLETLKSM